MPPPAAPTDGPLLDAPVALRPLVRADLPLLQRRLAAPHVHRWWFHETTDEALERDFGAGLRGEEPGEDLVAEFGGVPVGLVQRARWAGEGRVPPDRDRGAAPRNPADPPLSHVLRLDRPARPG